MAYFASQSYPRRGVHQYSLTGIPPIGDLKPTHHQKNWTKMSYDSNNNNAEAFVGSKNNNNNELNCLNKYKPLPPISNIPGLNPDSETIAAAEKKVFRTFKVLETDSSYVKLAKQGGRKNLLEYKEFSKEYFRNKGNDKKASKETDFPQGVISKPSKTGKKMVHGKLAMRDSNNNDSLNDNNNIAENDHNNNNNNNKKNNNTISDESNVKKAPAKSHRHGVLKERPDILPVDNAEILKHLSAPKPPVLPKMRHYPRLATRFVKVGGR